MANKRDLKSYIRFDGSGRIIPGGNILARWKPKVGRWFEGPAYACCNPTTTTTTCIPLGTYVGTNSYAGSILIGAIIVDFHLSGETACDAIDAVNNQRGVLIPLEIDSYRIGDTLTYYYSGTCTLVNGYYIFNIGESLFVFIFTDGEPLLYPCTTTTTSTETPTTTTTTSGGPS